MERQGEQHATINRPHIAEPNERTPAQDMLLTQAARPGQRLHGSAPGGLHCHVSRLLLVVSTIIDIVFVADELHIYQHRRPGWPKDSTLL